MNPAKPYLAHRLPGDSWRTLRTKRSSRASRNVGRPDPQGIVPSATRRSDAACQVAVFAPTSLTTPQICLGRLRRTGHRGTRGGDAAEIQSLPTAFAETRPRGWAVGNAGAESRRTLRRERQSDRVVRLAAVVANSIPVRVLGAPWTFHAPQESPVHFPEAEPALLGLRSARGWLDIRGPSAP